MSSKKNIPELRFPDFDYEWDIKRIKEITKIKAGGTPSTLKKEFWNGSIPWMNSGELNLKRVYDVENRITELGLNKSSARLVPKESILIGLAGQGKTRGTAAINYISLSINQSIAAIYPNDKVFSSEFLYQNIDSRYAELRSLSLGGGGRGGLNLSIIGDFSIPVPSLDEQQKISSFLTSVDDKINLLSKKKELLERYKKGVIQKIFSQEIRFKDDNGNDFPDWEDKILEEIANYRRGSFPQPYGLSKWYDDVNGFPFIQVYDVGGNMMLKPTTKRKISDEAKELSVFVNKETIILTIQGSIGRVAITQYDACVDRTLLIFESFKIPIDKKYFIYLIYLLFEVEKRKAPGGTIKTITKQALGNFKVKVPSETEQQKIGSFLFSLDKKIGLVDSQIDKTKEFKKGLLQQMFV